MEKAGLGGFIADIPTVPVKKGFEPLALTADQEATPLFPLPEGYKYVNRNAENTPVYMMPDQNSPRLTTILVNGEWPLKCLGATENGFIALPAMPDGGCIYCYDPVEVQRILKK